MTHNSDLILNKALLAVGPYALIAPHVTLIPASGGLVFGAVVWLNTLIIDKVLYLQTSRSILNKLCETGKLIVRIAIALFTILNAILLGYYSLASFGYQITFHTASVLFAAGFLLQALIINMPIDNTTIPGAYPEWVSLALGELLLWRSKKESLIGAKGGT